MGLVFISWGEGGEKGKGSSSHFIPYEGHIPERAALLPEEMGE